MAASTEAPHVPEDHGPGARPQLPQWVLPAPCDESSLLVSAGAADPGILIRMRGKTTGC